MVDGDSGEAIGRITAIDDTTINLLFVVERPDGSRVLIPAADDWVTGLDSDRRTITMTLPAGLLDIQ